MATQSEHLRAQLSNSAPGALNLSWLIASASCCAALLILTISSRSLWTDEAFSAYIASHKSLGLLASTLRNGDSSDLQMGLYYTYLHAWTLLFGAGEYALRAANIPFIILFAFAIVWTSWRVFHSKWGWIASALLPFLWSYASDVRPYFALVACSTMCFGSLLAYFQNPSGKERRYLPWLVLGSLFLGSTLHMLMLLTIAPLLIVVIFYLRRQGFRLLLSDWKPALMGFAVPFALLLGYLAWTFGRGTSYDYDRPGILSMGSVVYRFLGLSGFGPNRRYDISFRPYLPGIFVAGLALLAATAGMITVARRTSNGRFFWLAGALVAALLQVAVLSIGLREQVDVRHLAALTPLLFFLPLAALSQAGPRTSNLALGSLLLIAAVWAISDFRLLFLPEYKEEDFRSAVAKSISLYGESKSAIALVADPAAAEYYGLDLHGERPCFPLLDNCSDGFNKVTWIRKVPADFAYEWTADRIRQWLNQNRSVPRIVIISRTRHPMYKNSAWWPILSEKKATLYPVHGFFVYLFK